MARRTWASGRPIVIHDWDSQCAFQLGSSREGGVFRPNDHGLIVLEARYNHFPKNGNDLQAFITLVVKAYSIASVVLQVRNRHPGLPMNLNPGSDWEEEALGSDAVVYEIPASAIQGVGSLFDNCSVRAYWIFSFLPGLAETYDTLVREHDFQPRMMIEPKHHGGVFMFIDTDDCGVYASMPAKVPATDSFHSTLLEQGMAHRVKDRV